ncbi:hypothetical protein Barb4_03266 [Bacteroidales bacterium Barb4]|nr:hypothetical protein Barb4_03266 [Bacteroidales bacterium Barb4]
MQVAGPDAVYRGDASAQHVIYAAVLSGVLYCHYLLDAFHHAYQRLVALRGGANRAYVVIAYIMADLTVFHFPPECEQGGGEVLRIALLPPKHVKSEAEGCLATYSG